MGIWIVMLLGCLLMVPAGYLASLDSGHHGAGFSGRAAGFGLMAVYILAVWAVR